MTVKTINQIFKKNLSKFGFFYSKKNLLALSGGVDSIVLFDLLLKNKIDFAVSHCNYNLRDSSNLDQIFIENLCKKNNIDFYIKNTTKNDFNLHTNLSIQMAARKIRYNWFYKIISANNLGYLLTAHHLNDNLESFILNFTKGTSINFLNGIPNYSEIIYPNHNDINKLKIVRPLLNFTKAEILYYAKVNSLKWRDDITNLQNYYQRNIIRNQIIPKLKNINPSLEKTISRIQKFNNTSLLLDELVNIYIKTNIYKGYNHIKINLKSFYNKPFIEILLYHFLKKYGFNISQTEDISQNIPSKSKIFLSKQHTLYINQYDLIIVLKQKTEEKITISNLDNLKNIKLGDKLLIIEILDKPPKIFNPDSNIAYLDVNKITLPITIRKWQQGDRIVPLGIKKSKKVSDVLINNKIPLYKKSDIYVMISNNEIVWILGQKISDNFKINSKTNKSLFFKLSNV